MKPEIQIAALRRFQKEAQNLYLESDENAQPEVQQAIQRFRDLPAEERAKKPLLYWLLGAGTPYFKMSKEDSQYTDTSKVEGQTCENCEFAYLKPSRKKFICSQISGEIKPEGWCRLWIEGGQ